MFSLLPPQDFLDATAFLSAVIALFGNYPETVVNRAIFEIVGLSDRPTLRLIKKTLDDLYAPMLREMERQQARQSHLLGPPRREPRTPEQQARVDAQVENWRKSFAEKELAEFGKAG